MYPLYKIRLLFEQFVSTQPIVSGVDFFAIEKCQSETNDDEMHGFSRLQQSNFEGTKESDDEILSVRDVAV